MAMFGTILVSMLKGYVTKLATQEFAEWVLLQIAEAIVKNTKTKEDDKWFKVIKAHIKGEAIPED
jgi:hypothetical protein